MTPTERRFQDIYEIGCLACRKLGRYRVPCHIHHLNLGGHPGQERRGDQFTIGLCPWHHDGIYPSGYTESRMRDEHGPSFKLHKLKFWEHFGTDDALLDWQNELIARRRLVA